MEESQNLVLNLNEVMEEYAAGEEVVHLEPQSETTPVTKPERQDEESKEDKAFISDEAYSFWEKNMSDKSFIGERGFGKFISPFAEIIEKRGWSLFYTHKPPWFATVVREFYANMVEMKEDSVYVIGIWVPMGHERINEVPQIFDPKNGSKCKKLLREPNHEKIVDFLTARKGKWSSTKKNPHESINKGSLTKEAKV